jgi:hypothetical protein
LTAADAGQYDSFGYSVALSGDTLVVGASGHGTSSQGAAYMFARSGTTWTQQAELTAAEAQQDDVFGASVAMSGNTIAIAAPGHIASTPNGTVGGFTYVFVGSGSTWTQEAERRRHGYRRRPDRVR